jgi:hypothetical protein
MTSRNRKLVAGFAAVIGIAASVAVTATTAQAQEYAVSRRAFTFLDNSLDIEIAATSAGQLQVMRGESGRIDVAAHSAEGVASFGLTSGRGSTLTLTALGAKQADYVVVVPERALVRVKLPGRSGWKDADPYGSSRFRWDAAPDEPELDYSPPRPTVEGKYFVVGSSASAPARVRLFGKAHIRSVEVRLEGTEFQLWSSRPLTGKPGATDLLDVDAGRENVDLILQVPSFTRQFELRLEDQILLTAGGGDVVERCGPGVRQKAANGALRVKFRPAEGLVCDSARVH